GHEHRITRVASFGGKNVFLPEKAPATHCHKCPEPTYTACPYKDQAGFIFPVRGGPQIYHRDTATYGSDLCVYNKESELVDNQTVLLEWDHGVRGTFNLQLFQHSGERETHIWGEHARLDAVASQNLIRVTMSNT